MTSLASMAVELDKCVTSWLIMVNFSVNYPIRIFRIFFQKGYLVILPDYFRGEFCDPSAGCDIVQFLKSKTKWENLKDDWETKILPFAEIKGAKTFGAVGNFHIGKCHHLKD